MPKKRGRPFTNERVDLSRVEIDPSTGCWNWTGSKWSKGYGTMCYKGRAYTTHRLSWEHYRGEIPPGLHVLHKCDNSACLNPDHLFLGSNSDNIADMVRKGRHKPVYLSGEKNPRCKLTLQQCIEIRSSSESRPVLARRFGVNKTLISNVRNGRHWSAMIQAAQGDGT